MSEGGNDDDDDDCWCSCCSWCSCWNNSIEVTHLERTWKALSRSEVGNDGEWSLSEIEIAFCMVDIGMEADDDDDDGGDGDNSSD